MAFLDKIFGKKETDPNVYSPLKGTYVALENFPDEVISQGFLGKGCGIEPAEGNLYSPVDGEVYNIADSKHAVGIKTPSGAELLMHIGVDTVMMKGEGFDVKVSVGQKVTKGDLLIAFDMEAIKKAEHPATTALLITNPDQFASIEVENKSSVQVGDLLIKVQ